MKYTSIKICLVIAALFGGVASASDLPDCIEGSLNNCFGSYTWTNGDKYVGEWKNVKKNGQGTYDYSNGDKYVGEWKGDKANGQGILTFGPKSEWAGQKYVGQWKDDEKNGKGTHTYPNGDKYVGEFKDDNFNGQGTGTYADGKVKEGIWKDGEFQYAKTPTQDNEVISASSGSVSDLPDCPKNVWHSCFGTYTYDSGTVYTGEWRNGKRYGLGTVLWVNGNKFVGYFNKNQQRTGQGTYTFADGTSYVGEWKDSEKNGQGTMNFASGNKHVGQYKNNKRNGQGTYTWVSGNKYFGQYKDGKHHGQGSLTYANGDKFIGEWKDGKKNGQGTYTYPNGRTYVGEWKDGKSNGQGTETYADGTVKEGIWKDDEFQYAKTPTTAAVGTCLTKASLCSDTLLCQLAAPDVTNGKKAWFSSSSDYYKYVVEAKKRGLSCGVKTSSSTPTIETKVPKIVPSAPKKKPIKIVEYSLLIEQDGDSFMYISQLSDGTKVGNIVVLDGYKWFEKTFNNAKLTQVFIQPFGLGIEGNLSSYTNERYEIAGFSSEFVKNRNGDQFLSFNSRSAIAQINSYISKNENFDFAGLTEVSWYNADFHPANEIIDLMDLAKHNPDGFCFLLDLPITSTEVNRQLKVKNVAHLMMNNGVRCDKYNNVVFEDINNPNTTVETKPPKTVPVAPKKQPETPTESTPSLIDPLHIKKYGKTFHTLLLPNTILFIGEIEDGDERGFRAALRAHEVDTVVLLSGGGLINEGLRIANIINDKRLATYIPGGTTCASACSFMFFAGNPKVAHGRLGVHQFYVEDDKKKVAIGKVQKSTQYTVADIIQNLTDFGTPASVFPKMFSTSGMYYFSETEKSAFSDSNKIIPETLNRINEVLSYFIKDIDNELDDVVLDGMPQKTKSTLIQLELIRIGCMQGPVDGIKGEETKSAIELLSSKMNSKLSSNKFSDLFRSLNNTKVGACY